MDKVFLDVWRVSKTRDDAGSWETTIARELRSVMGVVAPASSMIGYFGEGIVTEHDISVLFECDCGNTNLWDTLRNAPHDLWLLVTDSRSFMYGRAFHVNSITPAALDALSADFFVIAFCRNILPEDAVRVNALSLLLEVT